jgi:exopolysaccharide/PEP-CTERM locus tyrosine autokinase
MSLVEKALQKLQAGKPAPDRLAANAPAVPVTRAADVRAPAQRPPTAHVPRTPAVQLPIQQFDPREHSNKVVRLDKDQLRRMFMIPPESQVRQIATQFRTIKRPLIRYATEAHGADDAARHTVMVASALPGDGKTFTSLNLGLSLALEMDFTVLLVDADAPKPHLTSALQLQGEPGLLDVLADPKRRLEDVILATDLPRFHVLPVGTRTETATELLASPRMGEVVAHLASLYGRGLVLFDSPPVLLTSESRSLAMMLGQIVLVVRAGVTPQQAVRDAIGILGEGRRISLVLNGAQVDGPTGYYYGHSYGHESDGDATQTGADSK